MAWPPKIAQFGRGTSRVGPVPRPKSEMKREFMQEAVLILLDLDKISDHTPKTLAAIAEQCFNEIEEKLK